ncbi:MAG: aromatic-L-amino-acid/L-tryptophan decarboxylase, partial [Pseudomonadota bacterium]|nr:aromatic-L-amino-acid/L-tryptophan decarboxylase [Pseudomonadota bacterium]
FHVDGAFGALARLSPALAPRLAGIERADSLALDFHKWGQVPYDAGFVLVREQAAQLAAFASPAAYLARHPRGLAAGSPWPCDLGPDLSRGFRALKVWFSVMAHGRERLGAAIEASCHLARRLAERVDADARLQRLAPVALNIVCLRYVGAAGERPDDATLDALNAELVADLHESGVAAPSTTTIGGRTAVRVALVNHRTVEADLDLLLEALHRFGQQRLRQACGADREAPMFLAERTA